MIALKNVYSVFLPLWVKMKVQIKKMKQKFQILLTNFNNLGSCTAFKNIKIVR